MLNKKQKREYALERFKDSNANIKGWINLMNERLDIGWSADGDDKQNVIVNVSPQTYAANYNFVLTVTLGTSNTIIAMKLINSSSQFTNIPLATSTGTIIISQPFSVGVGIYNIQLTKLHILSSFYVFPCSKIT